MTPARSRRYARHAVTLFSAAGVAAGAALLLVVKNGPLASLPAWIGIVTQIAMVCSAWWRVCRRRRALPENEVFRLTLLAGSPRTAPWRGGLAAALCALAVASWTVAMWCLLEAQRLKTDPRIVAISRELRSCNSALMDASPDALTMAVVCRRWEVLLYPNRVAWAVGVVALWTCLLLLAPRRRRTGE